MPKTYYYTVQSDEEVWKEDESSKSKHPISVCRNTLIGPQATEN